MRAERVMGERDRPYGPSWVDRLGRWVAGLPLPAWAFYVGLGLGLLLIVLVALSIGGIEPAGTILYYYALSAFTPAYFLALIYHLDVFASAALARFRPVLTVDDAEYARLHREFTTMPARPA
jgi:hypothetical protein